jgi:hypothetical protein
VKLSSASGSQTYVQTDTINPGKRYIMVWNSAISDNSGTKYALTDNSGNVQMTAIDDSWISDDGSSITVPAGTDTSSQWDIIWNQGTNEARGYLLQNVGTKNYLCNSDTTISLGNDPAASSASFKSYAWVYQDYNGYNQLAMYNDNTRFLRYSVGSATLKLGTQSTSTDVNNSNVYLYELVESELQMGTGRFTGIQ